MSNGEEERVNGIMKKKSILVDLHAHPIVLPENLGQLLEYSAELDYPIGFEGLGHGGITACFSANIDFKGILAGAPWHWENTITEVGNCVLQIIGKKDVAMQAFSEEDVRRAKKEGKLAFVTTLENGGDPIGNEVSKLQVLYALGVRCMGLTYTKRNLLGDGQYERTDAGLSDLGVAVVERMNKLGMLIDLSHSGKQTTLDTISISNDPVLVTHAGMRALNDTPRMKSDEEAIALAEKGGIFGIEAAPNALSLTSKQGIQDVLNHVDYAVKLVGVEHVGIGTDTLFGDHSGLHHAILHNLGVKRPAGAAYAEYMDGIESPSEWPNIVRGLVSRGYSDGEIDKIVGRNALRIMRQVLG